MKSINNEEEAYKCLARSLLTYVSSDEWDELFVKIEIYGKMIRASNNILKDKKLINEYREIPIEMCQLRMQSAFFLRDSLLKLTGDRIWGLVFTLYPDGKFEIEYDYNKPEDYEETDEVITGEEINQTIFEIALN